MNTIQFHKTTTNELLAIKDRVRYLINHWGEDGRYQEAVLKSVIARFIPEKFCVASGFVIRQSDNVGEHDASNQIDIIIYDRDYPVLFKEGDFAIVTADAVEAVIEVKANLKNQGLEKVIRKSNEIGKFIYNGKQNKNNNLFNGVFSYEGYENLKITRSKAIKENLIKSENSVNSDPFLNKFKVNHISFNKNHFYKFWNQNDNSDGGYIYDIEDLSFSFFISNLISHLKKESVFMNNRVWFPVDKNLNSHKL